VVADAEGPNQQALAAEFNALLVQENVRYRDMGLSWPERVGAFLAAALAVGDIEMQKMAGRAMEESEFSTLAATIYRSIRTEMTKGPSS
jgi:hypothetical protein